MTVPTNAPRAATRYGQPAADSGAREAEALESTADRVTDLAGEGVLTTLVRGANEGGK